MRFLVLCTAAVVHTATFSNALMLPKSRILSSSILPTTTTSTTTTKSRRTKTSLAVRSSSSDHHHTATVEEMKADIERMRQEALHRLELLNEEMGQAEVAWKGQKTLEEKMIAPPPSSSVKVQVQVETADNPNPAAAAASSIPTSNSFPVIPAPHQAEDMFSFNEAEQIDALVKARVERDQMHFVDPVVADDTRAATTTTSVKPTKAVAAPKAKKASSSAPLKYLDDTRWRLMLNIGREPGTWMPKTWGVSGDRLRLHLELEFSPEQLYEREEFLNGVSGAKLLKVVHGQAELSPTMQQGGRQVRIGETGGWRVAPNEGPMGTSVLRFYFDLEEETRHAGSDVYCPAGRIYCTCGYFPMQDRQQQGRISEKDFLKQEMRQLEAQYATLAAENEADTNLVSWNKVQRSKKMMDLRMQATKLNTKMHEAQVREPDRSLLRLSQDQSVGLTREGGVCCKVQKGLAIEYHILGKFEIASMTNREHLDYRELLP